jgi:hypothetical protein
MVFIKKLLLIAVWIILLVSFPACSATGSQTAKAINTQSNQLKYTWSIILKSTQIAEDLNATQNAVQYNGDTVEVTYREKPGEGNTFLLVELLIEKKKSGAAKFEWGKVYVLDSAGVKFYRHENDTFLESFNFNRIKSTDLTFGKNEGFICFEISKKAAKGKLYLIYESLEGENRIRLK